MTPASNNTNTNTNTPASMSTHNTDTTMNTTTTTISPEANALVAHLSEGNGQFRTVTFKSNPKPAAAFKGVSLEKVTSMVVRTGVDFSNLTSVKDGIANGERGEVQSLPWGSWVKFPFIISHKGEEFVRLTLAANSKPSTTFKVDGVEVSREEFVKFLTPSDAKGSDKPLEVITIKFKNLISIG